MSSRTFITGLVLIALVGGAAPDRAAVAQPSVEDGRGRDGGGHPSAAPRLTAISRTPEGLRLSASKAEIVDQISRRWGIEYMPLPVVWNSYWYPRATRAASGRFLPRRCFYLNVLICEGTILQSTTASMIEVVAFRDRVFRISITLPVVPDYRLQTQNMLALLRQKYGPPSRDLRWRDESTELIFDNPIVISPGMPATLHYVDVGRNTEVQRIAHKLVEDRNAEQRARSLVAPKGY